MSSTGRGRPPSCACVRPDTTRRRSARWGSVSSNHAAIAARHAIRSGRASRVAILDWDAHHGNGTQDIFWTDPDVLYVSLHQYPWYPGTGDATERGEGPGLGTIVNVPLPSGAAEDAFDRAFAEVIEPAVAGFAPDLVIVSAGFDAHHFDPLCMLRLTAGAYHRMTVRAAAWGPGPVCVLEGGYDLDALAWSSAATLLPCSDATRRACPRTSSAPCRATPRPCAGSSGRPSSSGRPEVPRRTRP